ncbi:bile acid:sodium symporter family protein [Flavobacteriaceae bacterium S356]|uniref:Bile acid:sodium symporter family protein n=1 Tax=Asprobacillus argus TaxID=3076534 RepID=A0ABU3LAZ8_9FLAO|nr:bile acid:sodium symporter family protein [Flavobacteriaceae bacterium S356]
MDSTSAIILAVSLAIIMLGMGLSLIAEDFKRIFLEPKSILIGLTNQLILLPLIAFGLASIFPLQPEIAVGVMILAACPGGATSNLIAHLAGADTALSVTLTAFSSFITILTIPFIVNFSLEQFLEESNMIQLDVVQTFLQILMIIIIPITIGMLIRKYKENFALKMAKPVRIASALILILVIVGIIIKEKDTLAESFQQAGLVVITLNLVVMFVGYYSAKMFSINNKRALSIAIESGIQNGTLGITVAVVLLGSSQFAVVSAIYGVLMFFTGAAAIYIGSRQRKKQP